MYACGICVEKICARADNELLSEGEGEGIVLKGREEVGASVVVAYRCVVGVESRLWDISSNLEFGRHGYQLAETAIFILVVNFAVIWMLYVIYADAQSSGKALVCGV